MQYTAKELSQIFENSILEGNPEKTISAISSLSDAKDSDLSFLGNKKYVSDVAKTKAGIILLPQDFEGEKPSDATIIKVANPSLALAKLCAILEKQLWPKLPAKIHQSAVVEESAKIAEDVYIGPNVTVAEGAKIGKGSKIHANNYIGRFAEIGEDCVLLPNSIVMDYCVLKNRVKLQPGAVIGSDGYGYEYADGKHNPVPQIGIVMLEDDVDIGANTCIDRARFDKTIIKKGAKLDNLVQIAHNVEVGELSLLVSQVGISGSTKIGKGAILAGQVGVAGHLNIGDGAKIGGQSGVNGDIKAGEYVRGTPTYPFMYAHKVDILKGRLPEIVDRLKTVEKHLGITPPKNTDSKH